MHPESAQRKAPVVGRESELALLEGFIEGLSSGHSLVLTGGPGIGKTTLWEAGVRDAGVRGLRVLSARASSAEAQLSFAALIDLCDGVETASLASLVAPQRSALAVALLRAQPGPEPPESHAIALGFLNMLRTLSASSSRHWLRGLVLGLSAKTARKPTRQNGARRSLHWPRIGAAPDSLVETRAIPAAQAG